MKTSAFQSLKNQTQVVLGPTGNLFGVPLLVFKEVCGILFFAHQPLEDFLSVDRIKELLKTRPVADLYLEKAGFRYQKAHYQVAAPTPGQPFVYVFQPEITHLLVREGWMHLA